MSSKNPFGEIRQPITVSVENLQVKIAPLKGREATQLAFRFGKAVGPVFAVLAGEGVKRDSNLMDQQVDIGSAINSFFSNVSSHEFDEVVEALLGSTTIANNRGSQDLPCFVGRPELILNVAVEVAKYQFQGFFSAWLPRIQEHMARAGER